MDSLINQTIIKFHPDTMQFLRKEYNFDKPGQMDEAIDSLDHWIKKQQHFMVTDISRNYLERQIILNKGSVERAKAQLEKLFTMRTLWHKYYFKEFPEGYFQILLDNFHQALLPTLTKDHYRVYIGKPTKQVVFARAVTLAFEFAVRWLEYERAHEYCNGYVAVFDYRYVNVVDLVSKLSFMELKRYMTIMMEGYQTRIKSINFITSSKAIELFVKLLKQAVSAKVASRIHVHSTIETLYETVPKQLLPKDYGGEEESLESLFGNWYNLLTSEKQIQYYEEMSKIRVDEAYRTPLKEQLDDTLGVSGTFKSLSID